MNVFQKQYVLDIEKLMGMCLAKKSKSFIQFWALVPVLHLIINLDNYMHNGNCITGQIL